MSYQLIQTEWIFGSNFNKGLQPEQFFYNQIFESLKYNYEHNSLPFFNDNINKLPRELTTGKIIDDENLIALEQVAAAHNYNSNVWLYGSELKKLEKEGIRITLKPDAVPCLCYNKFRNQTLSDSELNISDGGTGSKYQYLYNFDSLDERSQKAVEKYYKNIKQIDDSYTYQNLENYKKNALQIKQHPSKELKNAQQRCIDNSNVASISISAVINAQYKHMLKNCVGGNVNTGLSESDRNKCYEACSALFLAAKEQNLPAWKVGERLTKSLDSGTWYGRTVTSPNFNCGYSRTANEIINNHKNITKASTWEH